MPVAHQIADQAFVVLHRLGAFAIADARGLTDRFVVAHIIDNAHEPMIKNIMRHIQMFLHPWRNSAQGRLCLAAEFVNFGLLGGGHGHGIVLCKGVATGAVILRSRVRRTVSVQHLVENRHIRWEFNRQVR
jgi:hypothetical protein